MADKKSAKLHVEIAAGNWKRMETWLKSYNNNPRRLTPKRKVADVINAALVAYLAGKSGDAPHG